jgi:hypothetical protein
MTVFFTHIKEEGKMPKLKKQYHFFFKEEKYIMLLYHDIPSSRGVENALRRAKQMAEVQYTPVKKLRL